VLVSTSCLEVVNTTSEVIIDDIKHSIKLLEEWGCNLGEDAFQLEDEKDSRTEAQFQQNDAPGMEDI